MPKSEDPSKLRVAVPSGWARPCSHGHRVATLFGWARLCLFPLGRSCWPSWSLENVKLWGGMCPFIVDYSMLYLSWWLTSLISVSIRSMCSFSPFVVPRGFPLDIFLMGSCMSSPVMVRWQTQWIVKSPIRVALYFLLASHSLLHDKIVWEDIISLYYF